MALWTPYVENSPLDLTVKCKSERVSPAPYTAEFQRYQSRDTVSHSVTYPVYVGYPQPKYVPTAEPLPVPSCSGYAYRPDVPPMHTGVISPPESPDSVAEKGLSNYMMDVDFLSDDPDFQAFERDALAAMAEKNGGTLLGNNPRMRRAVQRSHAADDSYRKQRERNNFAAKQSRDRRKMREIHLALKVSYLKNEVSKLKNILGSQTCVRCHHPRL